MEDHSYKNSFLDFKNYCKIWKKISVSLQPWNVEYVCDVNIGIGNKCQHIVGVLHFKRHIYYGVNHREAFRCKQNPPGKRNKCVSEELFICSELKSANEYLTIVLLCIHSRRITHNSSVCFVVNCRCNVFSAPNKVCDFLEHEGILYLLVSLK